MAVNELMRTPGQPLGASIRELFEPRFGHDLGSVRIHADPRAALAAQRLGARAYTYGSDIAFAPGKYAPATRAGLRLLAHELAHVSQQRNARLGNGPQETASVDRAALEEQADAAAQCASTASASSVSLRSLSTPALLFQQGPEVAEATGPQPPEGAAAPPRTHSVAAAIALLNQAKELALAQPPQEDRALAILDDTLRFFRTIGQDTNVLARLRSHGGINASYAQILIGRATGAVSALGARIRIGQHPSQATWDFELRNVAVGREYLEVAAGDMEAGESAVVAGVDAAVDMSNEMMRTAVELTPFVGSIIMLGEALSGKSILGKDLSTTERAILGAGALLAEVGSLIKAGRTAVAATRLSTVTGRPLAESLRLCMASRVLTEVERARLAEYALKVAKGTKLADKEVILLNRLIGKMSEADRAFAVRAQLITETGTASQAGRFTNLDAAAKASEKTIGQSLAKTLGADVVKIETNAVAAGAKNPDFLINNVVAELIEIETSASGKSPIVNALKAIVDKHTQAGIVIVDVAKSVISAPELLGSMDRLWGSPRFTEVTRVIIARAGQVFAIADRPASIAGTVASTAVRGAAKVGETSAQPAPTQP
jgi:hypothetical protein